MYKCLMEIRFNKQTKKQNKKEILGIKYVQHIINKSNHMQYITIEYIIIVIKELYNNLISKEYRF